MHESRSGLLIVHFLFICVAFFRSSAICAAELSLQAAIHQARSQSLDSKRAAIQLQQARLAREGVSLAADPRLNLQGTWGSRSQLGDVPNSGITRQHIYAANLTSTLLDFGRTSSKVQQAELSIEAKKLAEQEMEQELFWLTTKAYQDVVFTARLASLAKEQITLYETRLNEMQGNYRQGLRPEADVVTAQVDLGRTRIVAQSAVDDWRLASLKLQQLMHGDDATESSLQPFEVPTTGVATAGPEAWTNWVQGLPADKASVTAQRLEREQQALSAEQQGVDAQLRPSLSAALGAQTAATGAEWTPLNPSYSGQLILSWDVPWNGMNRNDTARILLEKQDKELQLAQEKRLRREQANRAREQLSAAVQSWADLSRQLDLVTRQQALVRQRYLSGQATALELSASQTALINARMDRVRLSNSVAGLLVSLAEARGVTDISTIGRL